MSGESDALRSGSPPEWKKQAVRGGTSRALLVWIVIVGLAGLLAVTLVLRSKESGATEPLRIEQTTPSGVSTGRPSLTLAQDEAPVGRTLEEQQAELQPAVFDGSGTIAGHVFPAPGTEMPERWTLIIEPSLFLRGRDRAVKRTLERNADEAEFEIKDLPQAGYVVRASAPGMNSSEMNVLLARGLERQYVNLKLKPAGFIDGGVTNTSGAPLDGVRVVLESVATKVRVETQTDLAGNYIFRGVLDGEYQLYFGSPDDPLLPVQSVLFQAPSLRFPTREIPHDSQLAIRVVNQAGQAVVEAKLQTFGPSGGAVEGVTDSLGEAAFRFLPSGRYTVIATLGEKRVRGVVELPAHESAQITLKIED